MVVTIIEERMTIKDISGKTSELGTPIAQGREAKTAAAKPRGNIIVIKDLADLKLDFILAILIIITRIPRNTKVSNIPKSTNEKEEKANSNPVNTKKNERIKKLI